MEVDMNRAKVMYKTGIDVKEQVAHMVAFGMLPPKEMAEHLLNNPSLSEEGQKNANVMYTSITGKSV